MLAQEGQPAEPLELVAAQRRRQPDRLVGRQLGEVAQHGRAAQPLLGLPVDEAGGLQLAPGVDVDQRHPQRLVVVVGPAVDLRSSRDQLAQPGQLGPVGGEEEPARQHDQVVAERERGQHRRQRHLLAVDLDDHGEVEPVGGGRLALGVGRGLDGIEADLRRPLRLAEDRRLDLGDLDQPAAPQRRQHPATQRQRAGPAHVEPLGEPARRLDQPVDVTAGQQLGQQLLLGLVVAQPGQRRALAEAAGVLRTPGAVAPPPHQLGGRGLAPGHLEQQPRGQRRRHPHGAVAGADPQLTHEPGQVVGLEAVALGPGHLQRALPEPQGRRRHRPREPRQHRRVRRPGPSAPGSLAARLTRSRGLEQHHAVGGQADGQHGLAAPPPPAGLDPEHDLGLALGGAAQVDRHLDRFVEHLDRAQRPRREQLDPEVARPAQEGPQPGADVTDDDLVVAVDVGAPAGRRGVELGEHLDVLGHVGAPVGPPHQPAPADAALDPGVALGAPAHRPEQDHGVGVVAPAAAHRGAEQLELQRQRRRLGGAPRPVVAELVEDDVERALPRGPSVALAELTGRQGHRDPVLALARDRAGARGGGRDGAGRVVDHPDVHAVGHDRAALHRGDGLGAAVGQVDLEAVDRALGRQQAAAGERAVVEVGAERRFVDQQEQVGHGQVALSRDVVDATHGRRQPAAAPAGPDRLWTIADGAGRLRTRGPLSSGCPCARKPGTPR